jgi:hypothetical protein
VNSLTLTKCVRKVKGKIRQRRYSRTPFTQTMVIWITNYLEWLGPLGKFVKNSTKLTCLEITGYRIKYSTVLWLLELQIRHSHKVQTQVRTINSNSRSSNCQYSLFSKKNLIVQVFCISRRLANPINLDKWSSTVVGTLIPCVTHL